MIAVEAPAKVNLTLRVLARQADGYHSLETLFCAISLSDHVRVGLSAAAGVELRIDGTPPTADQRDNLVVRAAKAFGAAAEREPGVVVRLAKRIPSAAGLGGGSSDAAATLLALNALRETRIGGAGGASREDLLGLGADLGSDVPFFLCGSPLALAWSRGERMLALPALPSRPVLVANPGVPLPTPEAFGALAGSRGPDYRVQPAAIDLEELGSWDRVAALAANDFEPFAIARVPRVGDAIAAMREAGAVIAMLAGSGASIFGVFPSDDRRDSAEAPLRTLGFETWRAETLEKMPLPRRESLSFRDGERLDPPETPG